MEPTQRKTKIAFIVPFLHPQSAKDYSEKIKLLCKTLKSIGNQTWRNFRIIVVYNRSEHDRYLEEYQNDYIDFVSVNLDPLEISDLKMYIGKYYHYIDPSYVLIKERQKRIMLQRIDKGCRITLGIKHAQQYNPEYLMFCDADDYVSNKIVETIYKYPKCNGWFIDKGYVCDAKDYSNMCRRNDFYLHCGTSFIMKANIFYKPETIRYKYGVLKTYDYLDKKHRVIILDHQQLKFDLLNFTMKHSEILDIMDPIYVLYILALHKGKKAYFRKIKYPLKSLPIIGAVYLVNQDDSIFGNKKVSGQDASNLESIYKEFSLE